MGAQARARCQRLRSLGTKEPTLTKRFDTPATAGASVVDTSVEMTSVSTSNGHDLIYGHLRVLGMRYGSGAADRCLVA